MLRFYSKLTPTSHPTQALKLFVASEVCARQAHVRLLIIIINAVNLQISESAVLRIYFYTVILSGEQTIHEFGK